MENYDMLKLENQLCFPLYAASREVVKKYHPLLSQIDLTYTQYITMMVMWEVKEISVKELGKKLYLDSGTLTPLLKSLEQKGFIKRFRSDKDERLLIAQITNSGEELKEKAKNIPASLLGCVNLTPDEAKSLYSILYKILNSNGE